MMMLDTFTMQGVDNVIPVRPFCVLYHVNAASRKSSLHPLDFVICPYMAMFPQD